MLRAGVAARARLTVAFADFECLGDAVLGLRRLDLTAVAFLLREAWLRTGFLDRFATLAGRFVFTPPPYGPGKGPTFMRILAKGPQECATIF